MSSQGPSRRLELKGCGSNMVISYIYFLFSLFVIHLFIMYVMLQNDAFPSICKNDCPLQQVSSDWAKLEPEVNSTDADEASSYR